MGFFDKIFGTPQRVEIKEKLKQYENEYNAQGELIKEYMVTDDGILMQIFEYENNKNIKTTNYRNDGQLISIDEYKNNEMVKSTYYTDDDIFRVEEYQNGQIIKETLYNDGDITKINEYDSNEEVSKSMFYSDGDIMINEYVDGEEVKMILYSEGKIISAYEYKNGEEIELDISDININKNPNEGYVYVLVNSSINNMVKIGKTTRTSEERAKEISSTTGVATPFIVAFDCKFNDCSMAETHIHKLLEQNNKRTSNNREFFNISSKDAISLIMAVKEELDG